MESTPKHSLDILVERHGPMVARVCRSILRDDHLGNDASQETFSKLWQRMRSEGAPEHSGAWLRRVACSTSLDLARKRRLRPVLEDEGLQLGAEHLQPLEEASLSELQLGLERALECLSESQRTIFLLRHDAGLVLAEVAELLELGLPTIKTQFARACVKLQSKLARFDPLTKESLQ